MDMNTGSVYEKAGARRLPWRCGRGAASLRDKGRFFVRGGLAFALQPTRLFVFNETHERAFKASAFLADSLH